MRANMIIEKGATDRRLVHIFIDYKSNRLVLQTGRLFLCLIIILAECVSGTKAGDAEAHNCNEVHNTHWLSPPFHWIPFSGFYVIRGSQSLYRRTNRLPL